MIRLIAFMLNANESLEFTKGLSSDDEPFAQEVKILSRRAIEPFEVGLPKQLLWVVDPNAGRIGAVLIHRVANRFLRQESQNL
jgi:uncharacterized protein YaeQ